MENVHFGISDDPHGAFLDIRLLIFREMTGRSEEERRIRNSKASSFKSGSYMMCFTFCDYTLDNAELMRSRAISQLRCIVSKHLIYPIMDEKTNMWPIGATQPAGLPIPKSRGHWAVIGQSLLMLTNQVRSVGMRDS